MNNVETFTFEGVSASVEETADALTYHFVQQKPPPGISPVGFIFVLVLYPLALLAFVVYAHSKVANRPEWEDVLVGVFCAQLLVWLVTGTSQCYWLIRSSYRPSGTVLKFTRAHVWHGSRRVCELEQVRGLRLFVYSRVNLVPTESPAQADATAAPPAKRAVLETEACLSLVIGEEGHTHGLFGGCEADTLRAVAESIHRRLAAFRSNQGMMTTLDALSVIETTETDAVKLMHTRPTPDSLATYGLAGARFVFTNRWGGIAWSVAMFAGLFASVQMIGAAGFSAPFILPYGLLAFIHFFLLVYHLGLPDKPNKRPK